MEQFDAFMEAIKRTVPVPIEIKSLPEDTDGYYHTEDKRIAIREGMSEVRTVSAAIHEVAHSLLHNREMEKDLQAQQGENPKPMKPKNRNTEEVEAESIFFAVCNYFDIQTAENSLGYIAAWSKGKELAELRASLETINNNQPTVAQPPQDAKSGKPIPLMDLLAATRREEKQSVMEQLKTKPSQTQEKSKKAPSVGREWSDDYG